MCNYAKIVFSQNKMQY